MLKIDCLTNLTPGLTATVESITAVGGVRRRLQDLGLIEGARVELVQRSPLGDPAAFRIRGAIIALRSEDSSQVIIKV